MTKETARKATFITIVAAALPMAAGITFMAAITSLGACAPRADEPGSPERERQVDARATLLDASGAEVAEAEFEQLSGGVALALSARNLPPGVHGFHIHETGSCQAPSFSSAGGHFNPFEASHGLENGDDAHLGDLPNLAVGEDGESEIRLVLEGVTLHEDAARPSLLADDGTALVIHAEADDYETSPAGAAGERIACGVIMAE